MKRLSIITCLIATSTIALAEAGKGIKFSKGQMILFALIGMAILAAGVLALSAFIYFMLMAAFGERKYWPTFLGSYIAAFASLCISSALIDDLSWAIEVIGAVVGAVAGYFMTGKKAG
jgi:hypothetical protein